MKVHQGAVKKKTLVASGLTYAGWQDDVTEVKMLYWKNPKYSVHILRAKAFSEFWRILCGLYGQLHVAGRLLASLHHNQHFGELVRGTDDEHLRRGLSYCETVALDCPV